MRISLVSLLAFIAILFLGCIEMVQPFDKIPPGIWRAELDISDEANLPFNFEVSYDQNGEIIMHILNGPERIEVETIEFGKNKRLKDTLYIDFPIFDSHIKAIYQENIIEGFWTVRNRENYTIPFVATYGQSHRFSTNAIEPAMDISGKWKVIFEVETEDQYPAIGEFEAIGNKVNGTFRTETGDYRFLQGELQGNQLMLSCFDGSHAFLFKAKINDDESLIGKFYSGSHYMTNWIARKDPEALLTDPYDLTSPINPDQPISFSLKNSSKQMISLDDPKYDGKAKLIMIMGTWCPNCLDESKFMVNYLKSNPDLDLEVIAIAFEKQKEEDKALNVIKNYVNRLDIPYEVLYGGYYEKKIATDKIQFVDTIISYPTLLFVTKDNKINKIHTGFSGPATSKYETFINEFEQEINNILQ